MLHHVCGKGNSGSRKRKQPESFEESIEVLTLLIEAKNVAQARMLRTNSKAARKDIKQVQRAVKRAVDKASEVWIKQGGHGRRSSSEGWEN